MIKKSLLIILVLVILIDVLYSYIVSDSKIWNIVGTISVAISLVVLVIYFVARKK